MNYDTGRNSLVYVSLFYVLVVLNEKKGKFNEYVINDLDVIQVAQKRTLLYTQRALISIYYSRFFQKFNKPLLCGSKDDFGVVVGDLSMGEEKLIENIQVVTDKLSNLFGFAMTKQGKSADKDKLFLKVSFMSLFCDEKMGGSSWLDTFYMAYNS